MFRSQRISLFLIVFGLLIAIGTGVYAHWYHDAKKPDLKFTSNAAISCNIDGYTFTHTRETYSDGVIYTDGWWRNPQNPSVSMSAKAHGAGWSHVLFYGNIDGKSHGDAKNPTSEQLGKWVGFLPVGGGLDHTISAGFTDDFNRSYNTYSWDASGSIKLIPVYWKWRFGLPVPTGSWEEASKDFHRSSEASSSGNWLVQKNWTTLNRASPGSSTSTSSTSSNGVVSSGCANNPTYNYCNDQGSCATRSTSGVPGECGHNYCCCTSGAPLYNGGSSGSSSSGSSSSGSSSSGSGSGSSSSGSSSSGSGSGSTPSDSSSDDSCPPTCGYEDDECAVTCIKCDEPYRLCTTQRGDCSVPDEGDDGAYGYYHTSGD